MGRPAPPGRGREEHPGSPTPISCSLRGEPGGGGGGRKESQCQGALPQGSGPTRCSVASSGPRSLILGMAVGEEVGQWSPWPLAAPAWDLSPQPLGMLLPGPQHPQGPAGPGSRTHPPHSWEASNSCPGTPITCCPAPQGQGQESEEENRPGEDQPESLKGKGQKGQAQRLLPAGHPVPQETRPGPHKPARPVGVSGHFTAAGCLSM